jgi:hypothetical protein
MYREHHHYQQHAQSGFENLTKSTNAYRRIPILSSLVRGKRVDFNLL